MKSITIKIDKISSKYQSEITVCRATIVPGDANFKSTITSSNLDNFIQLPFEGKHYQVIVFFDEWLTQEYENYLELPPVERRVTHHSFSAWRK